MHCRNTLVLLAVMGFGQLPAAVAQQPLRPPTVRTAEAPFRPVEPLQSAVVAPAAYVSQPEDLQSEYVQPVGIFPRPVAWQALVQHALAANPEIQAARCRAAARGARVPQAYSLPDPKLMTLVYLESIQTAAGPQDVVMSLSQKFPWFGKRSLRSQAAYHDAMAAYARAAAVELKVIERVKRAYFDLYFLQRAAEETRKLELRLGDVIEIARDRYSAPGQQKVGLEDVLLTEIELAKVKSDLVKLSQSQRRARARLAGTLHLPPDTPIEAVAQLERRQPAHTAGLLVELSKSCQPELDARRREVCRDRSATELACRNYWPDVTVSFNWHEIGTDAISPVANGRDAYSLGLGVNLPLYRNRLDAAVREARYNTAASRRRYLSAGDRFGAEVESLYAQFSEHQQLLAILEKEILPRAERTLDLSVESYRTGRIQYQQLIDTYELLLNYRIDYHKRVAMRAQAIASLERAVGCAVTGETAEVAEPAEQLPAEPLPR